MPLKIKWVVHHSDAIIPTRKTDREAGFDLFAMEERTIDPGIRVFVPIGVGAIMEGCFGIIFSNSSMKFKNLLVMNGVIDQDYIWDIGPCLVNIQQTSLKVHRGDPIGQIVFFPQLEFETIVTRAKKPEYGG
jgi:dUTP pyrophosphatase